MNYYAFIIGIAIAVYVVIQFRKTRLEKKKWVYLVLLATFPVYYWVFAVYAYDYRALAYELLVGLGLLALAFVAYKLNNVIGLVVLAIGYIGHAIYDVVHESLFHNAGAPIWWPEFCGSLDGLIALYLIYLAFLMKEARTKNIS